MEGAQWVLGPALRAHAYLCLYVSMYRHAASGGSVQGFMLPTAAAKMENI